MARRKLARRCSPADAACCQCWHWTAQWAHPMVGRCCAWHGRSLEATARNSKEAKSYVLCNSVRASPAHRRLTAEERSHRPPATCQPTCPKTPRILYTRARPLEPSAVRRPCISTQAVPCSCGAPHQSLRHLYQQPTQCSSHHTSPACSPRVMRSQL